MRSEQGFLPFCRLSSLCELPSPLPLIHRSLLVAVINLFGLRDTSCTNEAHLWVCLSISREEPWGNTESQLRTRIPSSLHLGPQTGQATLAAPPSPAKMDIFF